MLAPLVLGVSICLTIVFLTAAVVYRRKIERLQNQLYKTRFNLVLCRGSRPQPQAEKDIALFFDETKNQFRPLNTAIEDAD
jgi:hypothetical protein